MHIRRGYCFIACDPIPADVFSILRRFCSAPPHAAKSLIDKETIAKQYVGLVDSLYTRQFCNVIPDLSHIFWRLNGYLKHRFFGLLVSNWFEFLYDLHFFN